MAPTVLALLLAVPPVPQEEAAASAEQPVEVGWVVETFGAELPGGTGGIEVDDEGNVYVGDFGSKLGGQGSQGGHRVFRMRPDGSSEVFASSLRGASGNALGPDGSFYQSSIGGNTITRFTPDGESSLYVKEGLRSPVGIVVDDEGLLFVANCGGNTVALVDHAGFASTFSSDPLLQCPNGIALDDEHNLYVANFGNGDVIRIDWEGKASRLATLPGNNNGHLIHHGGELFVVARGAHQIYRVSLQGEVTLFAGSGKRGNTNGPALEATLSFPNDIAVGPDGSFYVNHNASLTAPHTELAPMLVRRIRLAQPAAQGVTTR